MLTNDRFGNLGAAFFEFHEGELILISHPLDPFAYYRLISRWLPFLNPETSLSGNDTLLTSEELYNNWVLVDVKYRKPKTA